MVNAIKEFHRDGQKKGQISSYQNFVVRSSDLVKLKSNYSEEKEPFQKKLYFCSVKTFLTL